MVLKSRSMDGEQVGNGVEDVAQHGLAGARQRLRAHGRVFFTRLAGLGLPAAGGVWLRASPGLPVRPQRRDGLGEFLESPLQLGPAGLGHGPDLVPERLKPPFQGIQTLVA